MPKIIPVDVREDIVDARLHKKQSRKLVAKKYGVGERTVTRLVRQSREDKHHVPNKRSSKGPYKDYTAIVAATVKLLEELDWLTLNHLSYVWEFEHGVLLTPSRIGQILKQHGVETDSRKRMAAARGSLAGKSSTAAGKSGKAAAAKRKLHPYYREMLQKKLKQHGNLDYRVKRRMLALLAWDKGVKVADIAVVQGVSPSTVRGWIRLFRIRKMRGICQLRYFKIKRRTKLTQHQQKELAKYIRANPNTNTVLLREEIEKRFGAVFNGTSGVYRQVKRLGFIYRKAKLIPRVPEPEVQRKWLSDHQLVIGGKDPRSVTLYFDSVHPCHGGEAAGCWVHHTEIPAIGQATGRRRVNLAGLINVRDGRFHFQKYDRIDSTAIIDILSTLPALYPNCKRIYVILDNAPYHKSKALREWIDSQPKKMKNEHGKWVRRPRIVRQFLPAYCPHFNCIERLWRCMRKAVLKNKVHKTFKDFERDLLGFLNRVEENWPSYKSYVGAKFRIIDPKKYRMLPAA